MGLKLRFMEHHVLDPKAGTTTFAGVWVQGPDMARDLDYAYLPGWPELEERANEIVNAVVDADRPMADEILEHIGFGRPHQDAFSMIQETDEFDSIPALEEHVLKKRGVLK